MKTILIIFFAILPDKHWLVPMVSAQGAASRPALDAGPRETLSAAAGRRSLPTIEQRAADAALWDKPDEHRGHAPSHHSTVTLLARLRGLSTSVPRAQAVWYDSSCSGTVCRIGDSLP